MDINVSSDSKYEIAINLRNYDTGTCWKHKKKDDGNKTHVIKLF